MIRYDPALQAFETLRPAIAERFLVRGDAGGGAKQQDELAQRGRGLGARKPLDHVRRRAMSAWRTIGSIWLGVIGCV